MTVLWNFDPREDMFSCVLFISGPSTRISCKQEARPATVSIPSESVSVPSEAVPGPSEAEVRAQPSPGREGPQRRRRCARGGRPDGLIRAWSERVPLPRGSWLRLRPNFAKFQMARFLLRNCVILRNSYFLKLRQRRYLRMGYFDTTHVFGSIPSMSSAQILASMLRRA